MNSFINIRLFLKGIALHTPESTPPNKMNVEKILPLIVPASAGNKNSTRLPYHKFVNKDFILTWIGFNADGVMSFLTQKEYKHLDDTYYDWQMQAFENLRLSINEDEIFFTQHKMSSDGKRIIFIVFLNADGIGCSRVLFSNELAETFPNGYYIAIPDRSCGLIIAKDVTLEELDEIKAMVKKTYASAATPLSALLYDAGEFALPAEWTEPFDQQYSEELMNEIIKLRQG